MIANFNLGKWQVFPKDCHVFDGNQTIRLEPKAMDLLVVLAEANGQLVPRDDIFSAVWKNQVIADHVLYNLIANLRKVLEENPQKPKYLITVPKKGYRLNRQPRQLDAKQTKVVNRKWLTVAKILAFLIIIAIVIYGLSLLSEDSSEPIAITAVQPSIAVLPFDVYDSEPNLSYFADGLSEEIIHQLTAIPKLSVVSRTSSFAFRDTDVDIKTIAHKLNSQFILEGSIRKSEDQLRVTIQLIKAETGTHLWSKVFTSTERDVFTLQQNISRNVVDSLLPNYGQIPAGKLRMHPQFGDAYMHFLRGNAMAGKATVEDIQQAIKEFKTAIELHPDYALAHVSIAINTMVLYQYRVIESEEARRIAQAAIDSALEIAPFLASAHAAQGLLYTNYGNYAAAEAAFIAALDLDTQLPLAHHNYGYLLWVQEKHEQALEHFQIALARNPMSAISNFAVADSLYTTGQLGDALRQYEHCVALLPEYPACHLGIANFYRFTSQTEKAQKHMQLAEQQLAPDNIYWIRAKAIDAFWLGDLANASNMQNQIDTFEHSLYSDLQVETLINIEMDNAQEWLLALESAALQWPSNKSVALALALNYYYAGNCSDSLLQYESALLDDIYLHGKFNVAVWGVSHIANMADCYQQINRQDEHQNMMQLLTQQIATFKTHSNIVPGLILLEAKIDFLSGRTEQGKAKMKKLASLNWPLEQTFVSRDMFSPSN